MVSLQEAFIHAPEPCEGRFITDAHTLFHVNRTVDKKHPLTPLKGLAGQDNFLYNADWIHLKEECNILLCFEGE